MSKNKAITAAVMIMLFMTYGAANAVPSGPFGYDLQKDIHRDEQPKQEKEQKKDDNKANKTQTVPVKPTNAKQFYSFVPMKDLYATNIDTGVYYSNPTIKSAIAKYKKRNYTGCLQELYSYIKKHPSDAYAYYYMGMAYSRVGENTIAQKCYQKAINCNAKGKLLEQSLKGRDCITGGVYCHAFDANPVLDNVDPLDAFINAPYTGNGFSPELQQQYKQQQLNNLQKQINRKDNLNESDIDQIEEIQGDHSSYIGEKLAMAANVDSEPTDSEVLEAIDVLKRAGLNINTSAGNDTSSATANQAQTTNPASFVPNPEMQQINMLLGNGNNNNDQFMNMLPYMMNANNNGQKIDPQVIQSVMTNSMLNSLNNMSTNDNK